MSSGKTIIFNTVVTYSRSIISVGLTLFSSRWVLQALGPMDYGTFTLIGSIIMFITFLNSVLASSISRYFAFEIGKGISGEVQKWFNTSLSIHILMPVLLIFFGYPIGTFCIHKIFNIDPDRISICLSVFRISLISAFFGMVSVPYVAMFTARQKMSELAIMGVLQSVFTFLASYILLSINGDKLLYYSIFLTLITLLVIFIQIIRATFLFKECKIIFALWINKKRFIELVKFSFWNLVSNFGHLIRTQGLTVFTNLFFGTKANAALGISNQLSTQTSQLSNSLSNAVSPEIISSVGKGEINRAIQLAFQSTKLGIVLILLLTIPCLTETDYILRIWLKNYPENTSILCKLMILMFMIEKSTLGQYPLLQAVGKIARPQTANGLIFTSSLIIAFLFNKMNQGVQSVGWACVITMLFSSLSVIYYVKKYLNVHFVQWIKEIVLPYVSIALLSFLISHVETMVIDESLIRLFLNFAVNSIVVIVLSWFILLSPYDRHYSNFLLRKILKNKI